MGSNKFRRCVVFLWLLSLLAWPFEASAAKLYVVYASIGGTQAVGWVAKEAGLFAKHGLDVELLFTGGGRAVTSLLSGDMPIVTVGGSDVILIAHIFPSSILSWSHPKYAAWWTLKARRSARAASARRRTFR